MIRHRLILGACAASLALWSMPALAGCNFAAACTASAPPQIIVLPPLVMQQIETASTPIALPPAPDDDDAATGTPAPLATLDQGFADWLVIAPEDKVAAPPDEPLFAVVKVVPARRARPAPARTEEEIGAHLSIEVPIKLVSKTVPGIEPTTSGSGNRALWFAAPRP